MKRNLTEYKHPVFGLLKIGDKIPIGFLGDGAVCGALNRYGCCCPKDHNGPHISMGEEILEIWYDESQAIKDKDGRYYFLGDAATRKQIQMGDREKGYCSRLCWGLPGHEGNCFSFDYKGGIHVLQAIWSNKKDHLYKIGEVVLYDTNPAVQSTDRFPGKSTGDDPSVGNGQQRDTPSITSSRLSRSEEEILILLL